MPRASASCPFQPSPSWAFPDRPTTDCVRTSRSRHDRLSLTSFAMLDVRKNTSAPSPKPLRTASDLRKPASSRNPLALRLYKILGTRCDDPATREALQTVYELYRTPVETRSSSIKGKSAAGELDERIEDEDASPSASGRLAGAGIAFRARKHLRHDAERKLAEESRKFLKAFQEVDQVGVRTNNIRIVLSPNDRN